MKNFVVPVVLALCASAANAEVVVDIPPQDNEALWSAFDAAFKQSGKTVIRLAAGSRYEVPRALIPYDRSHETIVSDVELMGQGAHVSVVSRLQEAIFQRPEDSLTLADLTLSVVSPGGVANSPTTVTAIDIRGSSYWENVTITGSDMATWTLATMISLGYQSTDRIIWRNVSLIGNRMRGRAGEILELLSVHGDDVWFENVTIADNSAAGEDGSFALGVGQQNEPEIGRPHVVNSLIDACRFPVSSEGGNVFLDSRCGATANDRQASDARFAALGDHGGLVPTLAVRPDSIALGAGILARCPATDARGFVRGTARCDAGAFQFGAGAAGGKLSIGGANGTWYDPNGRGVLLVNRNNDSDVLLVWLSYDADAAPRWSYGVLPFGDDGSAEGVAYANDGPPRDNDYPSENPIGRFHVEFQSCTTARLRFDSTTAQQPSFELPLSRLSLVTQVGCADD